MSILFGGSLMGSFARTAGSIAAATLMGAGVAAASPPSADAQQVMTVPCTGSSGGASGLVTAIEKANAAGNGTIQLAANCNYEFTSAYTQKTTHGPNALPIITSNLTISGGPSTHILRKNDPSTPLFRLFEVATGARLAIREVFIEGGDAGAYPGGGILSARGTAVLRFVTVRYNKADNGAGITNDSGTLLVLNSLITSNTTQRGSAGGGGAGIYNSGRLALRLSSVSYNTANTSGGGIYNEQGGSAVLYRTTVNNNYATVDGGGLYNGNGGKVALVRTLVTANSAGSGGGVYDAPTPGSVTISGSQVTGNNSSNCTGRIPGCS